MAPRRRAITPIPSPTPRPTPKRTINGNCANIARLWKRCNQQQQASTAQAQAAQHQAALSGLEQQFILAGHPDYYERVNFIRQRRNHELELMGYMDPTERAQILANEAAMLVGGAIRQGRNPAAVAHELSDQWGYHSAGAAVSPQGSATEPGNSGAASAADRIRDLQRKKTAATSLQAIPRVPPTDRSRSKISRTWTTRPMSATSTRTAATWPPCSGGDRLDTPSGRMVIQRSAHLLTPG